MVSASTLAALPVPLLVEAFTSGPPYIVYIGGSSLHVLGYIDAAVVVTDVEIRHPLVVVNKLAFPLLLASDILKTHCAIIKLGNPDIVRFQVDRCPVCVEAHVPIALKRDAVSAVASVSSNTTLPSDAASRVPVSLPSQVVDYSAPVVEALPFGIASTSCAMPPAGCAITKAARVLSVANASNKPVDICDVSPIAAVSFVAPLRRSPSASSRQVCNSRRDARRSRRPRGRHRTPQCGKSPTLNAMRRRRSPSTSACYRRVWTPSTAPVTPYSGCVT